MSINSDLSFGVSSARIVDGTIVNADISATAAIAASKIAGLAASATTDTTNASNITSGTVAAARLPSYVDDVIEALNLAAFPATGETGKIYVALDTNKTYRWSGSAYVYITSGAVDSVAGKTGVVTLTSSDVGLGNVENKTSATIRGEITSGDVTTALAFTPVNKAGDTITGNLLNSAAYSAPSNVAGAGTTTTIQGSTGTGQASATGGNGAIEIIGGGGTSLWTSFASLNGRRRGGINLQAGTSQADAGATYVNGSLIQIRGSHGTNNGTSTGSGSAILLSAGSTTRIDTFTSNGSTLSLNGANSGSGGSLSLSAGGFVYASGLATGGSFISLNAGNSTQGGLLSLTAGAYNAATAYNSGGTIDIEPATAEAGGSIRLRPGLAGISPQTLGKAYVVNPLSGTNYEILDANNYSNYAQPKLVSGSTAYVQDPQTAINYEILDANNYSNYAQPKLVSGTNIKTINGTSLLGSGDIAISAGGVTSFNTRTGAITLSSGDVTGALGFTPYNATNPSGYITSSGTAATANALNTGNNYTGNQFTASGTNGYFFANRSAVANQAGIQFQTAGTTNWWNFLDNNNNTLTWYQSATNTQVMTLTQAGVLNVIGGITQNSNQVLHASNYSSYALPLSGGTLTGRLTVNSELKFGAERRYYVGNLTAGATPTRYEIARVYIDYNDWHSAGTIQVELQNNYYMGGDRQVWNISFDYNVVNCDLVESIGPRGRFGTVTCGSPTQISGDSYYLPVYVDVRYYGYYYAYVTTCWPEVTSHGAHLGAILVYTTPSSSSISDFTPSDAISLRASSLSLSGNAALHTSNYSSYALPLSGGTLTGALQAAVGITVNDGQQTGRGINLYSGSPTAPTYGLFFATTSNFGTYGPVSADWATYFTMNATTGRGWVFRDSETLGNVAAISNQGEMILRSHLEQGNNLGRPNVSWSASGTSTGMVIFYLPGTTANYGMVHMVFDIYEYNGNSVSTVVVGGHNWSTSWYNTAANVIGTCGKEVRLGVKDGRFCVVFGVAGSSWEYGTIVLRKIHNGGFYDNQINMAGNWSATQTPTESFSNIGSDLRALRTPASFNAVGAITQNGSQVLHASNVSSYALPISGGTLTGTVTTVGFVPVGVAGNSNTSHENYKFGYQESGDWVHPYPDLIIGYHTGIKFGALTNYGGMRFYADHPGNGGPAELFSIGNGDNHVRVANTLYIGGNTALHASNYSSYALPLSGGTVSGSTQIASLGVGTTASGTSGEIRATNNITAYFSSDSKFKENIITIDNASEIVNAIGGKYFDWTDAYIAKHGGVDGYFVQKSDFGVVAQDVQKHFPRAVRTRPDGSLAVDYEKLSALAFAAISEQHQKLLRLEALVELLINKDK